MIVSKHKMGKWWSPEQRIVLVKLYHTFKEVEALALQVYGRKLPFSTLTTWIANVRHAKTKRPNRAELWPQEAKQEALELYKTLPAKVVSRQITEKYGRELAPRLLCH